MIILKIIAPVLVLFLSVIQFFLDHKFRDKRTKNYKRMRRVFLSVISIGITFTIITIIIDDNNSSELLTQIGQLNSEIHSLKKQGTDSDSLSISLESNAKLERKNLEKQISDLQNQLNPFLDLATKKYPKLSKNDALEKLTSDFEKLKKQTEILEQRSKDRSFTETEILQLVSYLRNFPSNKITITAVWGDHEAFKYASKIKDIFSDAGWEINGVNQAAYNIPMQSLILSVKGEPVPQVANIVWKAFNRIGIDLPGNRNENQQQNEVALIIGSK